MNRSRGIVVRSLLTFCCLIPAAPVPVPADTLVDPFAHDPCFFLNFETPDGEQHYWFKIVRRAYAMESPFHVLLNETRLPLERHNSKHPDATVRSLYVGHGGYVFESAVAPSRWVRDYDLVLILIPWLGRCTEGELACAETTSSDWTSSRIETDPYTGNVFVLRMDAATAELVVIAPEGRVVAHVRIDLFSGEPLADLCGDSHAQLETRTSEPGGFFWFDVEKLAPFVDVYRSIDGDAYARFVVDAAVLPWAMEGFGQASEVTGMRLPFLPLRAELSIEAPSKLDRLQYLKADHSLFFRVKRPKKGGVAYGILPALKLLEARDCLKEAANDDTSEACPSYSAMALHTELLRTDPRLFAGDEGFSFSDVFGVISKRGLCREALYPFPEGAALGWPETVEQFAQRAEKAWNRSLKRGEPRIDFVDGLPPSCDDDMRRFLEEHELPPYDLAELMAAQHLIGSPLDESATDTLRRAQQQELVHMVVRLLNDGVPAVVTVGDEAIERALLAYGASEESLFVMDFRADKKDARQRQVMPLEEFAGKVIQVAYLRDDFKGQPSTVAQLRRSLEYADDIEWTYYRLGILLQKDGREEDAIEVLRKAVEIDPDDGFNWRELGESLSATAMFDEAAEAYGKAIELGRDTAYCHGLLGYVQRKLGRYSDAARSLERALELSPTSTWEMRQMGWTAFDSGDEHAAEAWFRKAREHDSTLVKNHVQLATFLGQAGRPDEAREALLDALELFSDAPDLGTIGEELYNIGDVAAALPVLERALALASPGYDAWYRLALGRAYRAVADTERLAAVLAPVLSRAATDAGGLIDLGFARALVGQHETCLETVEQFLELRSEPDKLDLYNLACIHALNGEYDRALDALEQALNRGFQEYLWARRDPDLGGLANDRRFRQLLER